MSRDYQEFQYGNKKIYVWQQPQSDIQSSVEHLLIVENGQTTILTSLEVKTVSDVIDLTEKSIDSDTAQERST